MYKNVTFAQGLVVLVPKQQSLNLTVGNAMQARQRVKEKFKLTRILKSQR